MDLPIDQLRIIASNIQRAREDDPALKGVPGDILKQICQITFQNYLNRRDPDTIACFANFLEEVAAMDYTLGMDACAAIFYSIQETRKENSSFPRFSELRDSYIGQSLQRITIKTWDRFFQQASDENWQKAIASAIRMAENLDIFFSGTEKTIREKSKDVSHLTRRDLALLLEADRLIIRSGRVNHETIQRWGKALDTYAEQDHLGGFYATWDLLKDEDKDKTGHPFQVNHLYGRKCRRVIMDLSEKLKAEETSLTVDDLEVIVMANKYIVRNTDPCEETREAIQLCTHYHHAWIDRDPLNAIQAIQEVATRFTTKGKTEGEGVDLDEMWAIVIRVIDQELASPTPNENLFLTCMQTIPVLTQLCRDEDQNKMVAFAKTRFADLLEKGRTRYPEQIDQISPDALNRPKQRKVDVLEEKQTPPEPKRTSFGPRYPNKDVPPPAGSPHQSL
jgi:hypothetical protein